MALRSLYSRIIQRRSGALLAVETDDLTTRAVICRSPDLKQARIDNYCEAKIADLGDALDEILPKLKSQGANIPSQAVFLSPQVHAVVLQLPINPKKPLPFRQFQELLRWEVEPYVARHKARRIGTILVGRGYLTATDLDKLLNGIEQNNGGKPRRLGDSAVEAGLITAEQLAECLALQQVTPVPDGDICCGWTPLDEKPEGGKWSWLVAAMGNSLRQQTVTAFAARGLRLRAAYPLVGGACASLNGHDGQPCAVFEYQTGHLSYVRYTGKRVASIRTVFTQEPKNPLRSCVDLFESQAQHVWLAGRWPDTEAALNDLGSCLSRPCQRIPASHAMAANTDSAALAGIVGTALQCLNRTDVRSTAGVPACDPWPPLWRNRWAVLGIIMAFTACGLFIGAQRLHLRTAELNAILAAKSNLELLQTEGKRLNAESAELEKSVAYLKEALPKKQQRVKELLQGLQDCCSEEIMIRRINQTASGDIELQGWGLSLQGIQAFKVCLQNQLREFTVLDTSKPMKQERGWRSLNGYCFEIRMSLGTGKRQEKRP